MRAGDTLRVRGEGGSEWDQDVPEPGTPDRELLDDAIAKGRVQVLDDPHPDQPGPTADNPEPFADTPELVADDMAAVLDRVRALDEAGQAVVMDLLDERFGGIVVDLPIVPIPPADGDPADGGDDGRPKVRDDVEIWRTFRAGQGHKVDGLTKPKLIDLPDTPKEA